jgi:hypothetical protein
MIAGSDPPPSGEQTFADVLNGLTFGSGGRAFGGRSGAGRSTNSRSGVGRRRSTRTGDGASNPALTPLPQLPSLPTAASAGWPADSPVQEPDTEPDSGAAIVRPYAWTRGRTQSSVQLQVETLVSVAGRAGEGAPVEHQTITELCHLPQSVAEIAARLDVPLGVAKVLISDLAEAGLLTVHRNADPAGGEAHLMLMERVLSGLRRL